VRIPRGCAAVTVDDRPISPCWEMVTVPARAWEDGTEDGPEPEDLPYLVFGRDLRVAALRQQRTERSTS